MDKWNPRLAAVLLLQIVCAFFFVTDMVLRIWGYHLLGADTPESIAMDILTAFGLIFGIVFGARLIFDSRRSELQAERTIGAAKGAFAQMTDKKFRVWGLTESERDIAWLSLKGFSQKEMAELRGSSAGTIKSHTNAIYRKSGTSGRGQLMSLLVEDLLDQNGLDTFSASKEL